LEHTIFAPTPTQQYKFNYFQAHLWPVGTDKPKSWSSIPEDVRNKVDGIMLLKLHFKAEDVSLFPRLKV